MEADNSVTFFLDPLMDNSFVKNVANEVQCVTNKTIETTDKQVKSILNCRLIVKKLGPKRYWCLN